MDTIVNITQLEAKLRILGFKNLKRDSTKTISILTDDNRIDVLKKVAKKFGGNYDKSKGSSSVGATVVQGFTIKARPASKQGKKSAGLDNEDAMIDNINLFCKGGPIKVSITDGRKKFAYEDVVECSGVGTDTTNRKKADVLLKLKNGKRVPISIKKDNAEMWESADSYWAPKAKQIVEKLHKKGQISLAPNGVGGVTIAPSVGVKTTPNEKKDVVFGKDLLTNNPKGFVVIRTFSADDFKLSDDGECLEITVTGIIHSTSQLTGDKDIYFLIRNDKSRKGSKIKPGLRVLAVSGTRINKNVLVIENSNNP